jgi:hypothetical protein
VGQGVSCSTSSSVGFTHFPDDLSVSVLVHTLVKRRCRSEPLPSFEPAARSVSQQKR